MSPATARLSTSLTHPNQCPLCGTSENDNTIVAAGDLAINQHARTTSIRASSFTHHATVSDCGLDL